MMAQGTIHGIQIARGAGVIRPDDGSEDLPFQRGALAAGAFEELREGQWVAFEITADPRDPARRQARDLRLLEE
jgi:cold shock CspA family protein